MRLSRFGIVALSSALACGLLLLALFSGCNAPPSDDDGPDDGPVRQQKPPPMTPMVSEGTGKLTGRIKLEGGRPDIPKLDGDVDAMINNAAGGKGCGNHQQQKWMLDAAGDLGNVVVMLRPEKNQYFPIDAKKYSNMPPVTIDQPGCAFTQHVVVVFPRYPNPKSPRDRKSDIPTGQKLVILNSQGDIAHSFKYQSRINGAKDVMIQPGKSYTFDDLVPDIEPLNGLCGVHPWMSCYIWVVDNPYFAITKPDGSFDIPEVPAGKCRIKVWHEALPAQEEEIELKAGDNAKDFTFKYNK